MRPRTNQFSPRRERNPGGYFRRAGTAGAGGFIPILPEQNKAARRGQRILSGGRQESCGKFPNHETHELHENIRPRISRMCWWGERTREPEVFYSVAARRQTAADRIQNGGALPRRRYACSIDQHQHRRVSHRSSRRESALNFFSSQNNERTHVRCYINKPAPAPPSVWSSAFRRPGPAKAGTPNFNKRGREQQRFGRT